MEKIVEHHVACVNVRQQCRSIASALTAARTYKTVWQAPRLNRTSTKISQFQGWWRFMQNRQDTFKRTRAQVVHFFL